MFLQPLVLGIQNAQRFTELCVETFVLAIQTLDGGIQTLVGGIQTRDGSFRFPELQFVDVCCLDFPLYQVVACCLDYLPYRITLIP